MRSVLSAARAISRYLRRRRAVVLVRRPHSASEVDVTIHRLVTTIMSRHPRCLRHVRRARLRSTTTSPAKRSRPPSAIPRRRPQGECDSSLRDQALRWVALQVREGVERHHRQELRWARRRFHRREDDEIVWVRTARERQHSVIVGQRYFSTWCTDAGDRHDVRSQPQHPSLGGGLDLAERSVRTSRPEDEDALRRSVGWPVGRACKRDLAFVGTRRWSAAMGSRSHVLQVEGRLVPSVVDR